MTHNPKSTEVAQDWKSFLESLPEPSEKELTLADLATGDRVIIKTRNTVYLFTWKSADLADLRSNKAKAPSGPVRIMGCSFGLSSSIRPDALFCGGNLEFTHSKGEKTWTTSPIEEIHLLHQSNIQPSTSP
jgi:hypothetical protein